MEFNDKLMFLVVLSKDGEASSLNKAGYSNSEIGRYCNELQEEGLIELHENDFVVTRKGKIQLDAMKGSGKFILEFSKFHRLQKNPNDVYIPLGK